MTSIAGVLYIPLIPYVAPSSFLLSFSALQYFGVVIGCPGSILGPLIGVALLYVVPNAALVGAGEYRLLPPMRVCRQYSAAPLTHPRLPYGGTAPSFETRR